MEGKVNGYLEPDNRKTCRNLSLTFNFEESFLEALDKEVNPTIWKTKRKV